MAASKQCKHKNRHTNSLKCDASSISAGIFSPICPQVAGETSAGHAIMYRCFDLQLPFCAVYVEAKPMTIFFFFLKGNQRSPLRSGMWPSFTSRLRIIDGRGIDNFSGSGFGLFRRNYPHRQN